MAHTNSTANYGLPQFIPTDKPAWLTDINGAFSDIDTAIDTAKDAADNAQNDATQALSDAGAASTAASAADAKGAGAVASIADTFDPSAIYQVGEKVMYSSLLYECVVAIVTPGPWTGSTNWVRITCENITDTLSAAIDAKLSASDIGVGGYANTGLSFTNCSLWGGTGVYKIGKLVNVNMRLVITTPIPAGTNMATGLPHSYNQFTPVANNKAADIIITENGELYTSTALSNGTIGILATYLEKS